MTNGDLIRNSTDEELAQMHIGKCACYLVRCEEHHGDCTSCSLEWLHEEVLESCAGEAQKGV